MGQQASTQQTIGYIFLALMVVSLIFAITEFVGDSTWIIILSAVVFLVVGLSLLAGPSWGSGSGGGQQQSVVLGGGRVLTQSSGGVLAMCRSCNSRIPETVRFCPDCGTAVGA